MFPQWNITDMDYYYIIECPVCRAVKGRPCWKMIKGLRAEYNQDIPHRTRIHYAKAVHDYVPDFSSGGPSIYRETWDIAKSSPVVSVDFNVGRNSTGMSRVVSLNITPQQARYILGYLSQESRKKDGGKNYE